MDWSFVHGHVFFLARLVNFSRRVVRIVLKQWTFLLFLLFSLAANNIYVIKLTCRTLRKIIFGEKVETHGQSDVSSVFRLPDSNQLLKQTLWFE